VQVVRGGADSNQSQKQITKFLVSSIFVGNKQIIKKIIGIEKHQPMDDEVILEPQPKVLNQPRPSTNQPRPSRSVSDSRGLSSSCSPWSSFCKPYKN
jgi:hypothetical protein